MIFIWWKTGRHSEGSHDCGFAFCQTVEEARQLAKDKKEHDPEDVDYVIIDGKVVETA